MSWAPTGVLKNSTAPLLILFGNNQGNLDPLTTKINRTLKLKYRSLCSLFSVSCSAHPYLTLTLNKNPASFLLIVGVQADGPQYLLFIDVSSGND